MNNHLGVLASLGRLNSSEKEKIHLILPMTYGGTTAYLGEVRASLEEQRFKSTILDSFLPEDELAMLRLGADVFIYAAESDAFSGTVSQYLMAQSVVLCGSWLPYGARREAGLYYLEFNDVQKLGDLLLDVIEHYDDHSKLADKNLRISVDFYDDKNMAGKWMNVYNAAIDNHKQKS